MTESTPSVFALIEILMRGGLSPETSLATAREIDETFGLSTRGRGSDSATREKWRLKKSRQRERRANVPPGTVGSAIEDGTTSKSLELNKKERNREITSPVSPGDKPARRSKGDLLPANWKPTEDHYTLGATLTFSRKEVDAFADRMRDWAEANSHRAVARKSGIRGWNAAFRNWLSGAAERKGIKPGGGPNETNRNGNSRGGFSNIAARIRHGNPDAERAAGQQPSAGDEPAHRY